MVTLRKTISKNKFLKHTFGHTDIEFIGTTEVDDAINALKTTSFNIEEDEDGGIIIKIWDSLDYLCDLSYTKSIFPILWKISK